MKSWSVTIQMKATEQYFHGAVHYAVKVVLTAESVDEHLKCDHADEKYCFPDKVLLIFESMKKPKLWRFKWKLSS